MAGALIGILGWFAANFVGAPLRRFFELRERVHQQNLLNSNLGPTKQVTDRRPTDQMIMDERMRVEAAASQLRLVASELTAFAIARKINTRLLNAMGYDVRSAGESLMGFANSIHDWSDFRFQCEREVKSALKLVR
jgi:hypothetical protein